MLTPLPNIIVLFIGLFPTTSCAPTGGASVAQSVVAHAPAFDQAHSLWADVLRTHVQGDRFDYKELKADRARLDAYVKSLERVTPADLEAFSRAEQFAFWINAYNAYTVLRVVDAYPIDSVKDLGDDKVSVWDQKFIPLAPLFPESKGEKLTLNDIEHKILRPKFKDARVHAAVNCASEGCPPLAKEAFTAARLDEQLDRQVKAWLAAPARNKFDKSAGKLEVSKVFDWFKEDFVRDAGSVQAWIAKYAPESERGWLAEAKSPKIEFQDYSWKLNDVR